MYDVFRGACWKVRPFSFSPLLPLMGQAEGARFWVSWKRPQPKVPQRGTGRSVSPFRGILVCACTRSRVFWWDVPSVHAGQKLTCSGVDKFKPALSLPSDVARLWRLPLTPLAPTPKTLIPKPLHALFQVATGD